MNCGAIQSFWSSGIPTAKNYIKDGLVAMWDGIENSGFSQHLSDTSVWKNLGSNGSLHDATRISSTRSTAWTDNAAVFGYNDSTYQFIIPGKLMMNVMKGEWPYELVFTPNQKWLTGTQYSGIFGNHGGGYGIVGGQKGGSQATIAFNLYYPNCILWQPSTSVFSSGTLTTVSQAASNTAKTAVTYKDGIQVASSSNVNVLLDHHGNDNTGNTCIGASDNQGTPDNGRTFDGIIHCIRIYTRPLTAIEVQKNHEIDIKRFSLSLTTQH